MKIANEFVAEAREAGRLVSALNHARKEQLSPEEQREVAVWILPQDVPPEQAERWMTQDWKEVLLEMQAYPAVAADAAYHLTMRSDLSAPEAEKLVPMLRVTELRLQTARALCRALPIERRLQLAREYDDLEILGDDGLDRASLDYLIEKLADADGTKSLQANLALSKASWMQPQLGFEALRPHLQGKPSAAILALAVGYPTEVVAPFAHLFEAMEGNPSAFRHLIALGRRSHADLVTDLKHPDPKRRGDALGLLADCQAKAHVADIAALLGDPDGDPRHRAVMALQRLDARDQVERIAELMDDESESVRDAVRQVLKQWKFKPGKQKAVALSAQDKKGALQSWRFRAAKGKRAARIGGKPDLPADLAWPEGLDFLAQLEAPDVGHLWFFLDPATIQDGPLARFAVLHAPSGTPLKARGKAAFPAQSYTLEEELSLRPDVDARVLSQHGQGREDTQHRYLGHAAPIQGDLTEKGWQLLLQIDSEEGRSWGDGGRLYFLIESRRFAKRDFSKVFLEMQCY